MAVIRFALYLDLMLLFGLPAFLLYNASEAKTLDARFSWTIRCLAALAPVVSILGFAMLCADMAGLALADLDRPTVEAILWQTPIGFAWITRMAALSACLVTAFVPGRSQPMRPVMLLLASGIALGSLAWTGHGAAGGWSRMLADITHLLAAGLWVGALGAFMLLLTRLRGSEHHASALAAMLARFAVVGSLAVIAIVVTGAINAWDLVGPEHIRDLLASPYGRLLAIKVLIFMAMLGLAAANRFRFTPQLERSLTSDHKDNAVAFLRISIALETTLIIAILVIVAYLGLLEPPTGG